ncbi:MAG: hypothetical protein JSS75_11290 [Bacteroidetes bacterium]|nr:hypothetical protein [Bacteroidota bacterium]
MSERSLHIPITYDQLVQLINRLPLKERRKLSKELERDFIERRFSNLLDIFKTDDLSEDEIMKEVEEVRAELHGSRKTRSRRH